ncbi:hypothetical protein QQS21_008664 [Conoideocrella luteorostrata]|uniref:FAS1 domain-containing protein n=1 Tax=Conoideocrella luteorostrata TaxID=1105319 RepID=A0AAJ0CMT7_9HYPO|nr:hypothetical protein QQS21_008664 [Conoideocrella luteorostrata]
MATQSACQSSSSDLLTTLRREGASKFAASLESDPDTLNLFLTKVKTVFAPSDKFLTALELQERDESLQQQRDLKSQGSEQRAALEAQSATIPGRVFRTFKSELKLGGASQVVVSDTRPPNVTGLTRRWDSGAWIQGRQSKRVTMQSLLRLSSGLGKITNVIKGDIKFDRGVIHITDRFVSSL